MIIRKQIIRVISLSLITLIYACKKDTVPSPVELPDKSLFEKVEGDYKVYDTLGGYLYEMSIRYWHSETSEGYHRDTLFFENFDNTFDFKTHQTSWSNQNQIKIQAYSVLDDNNKSWDIWGAPPNEQGEAFINDTLWISFWKSNFHHYINEATPYYNGKSKQFAVKQ